MHINVFILITNVINVIVIVIIIVIVIVMCSILGLTLAVRLIRNVKYSWYKIVVNIH